MRQASTVSRTQREVLDISKRQRHQIWAVESFMPSTMQVQFPTFLPLTGSRFRCQTSKLQIEDATPQNEDEDLSSCLKKQLINDVFRDHPV
jgi:hypothetical protein